MRQPTFSIATVLTLALGVGANTAIYSLVKGVLLDPLPYSDSDQLVGLWHSAPGLNLPEFEQSEATYLFYRDNARTLQSVGLYAQTSRTLTGEAIPRRLSAAGVTATMFETLAVAPVLGRSFHPQEMLPGAARVALVSYSLWQGSYGGSPSILGTTTMLNGQATEIIGVIG